MTIKQKIIHLFLVIFSTTLLINGNVLAAGPKETGTTGGKAQKSKSMTCGSFSNESEKNECENAWEKAYGTTKGNKFAKDSILDYKERREQCGTGDNKENPTEKYYCRAAYDRTLILKAKEIGKTLGEEEANKDNTKASTSCQREVKFGGDVYKDNAKKACLNSYRNARATAEGNSKYKCGDVDTYFNYGDLCKGSSKDDGDNNPIFGILLSIMNILAGLVSLAVLGGILYGAFLYTSARDNSQQTQKGIQVITDAVIALILYFALYAIINYLVPGGLFQS